MAQNPAFSIQNNLALNDSWKVILKRVLVIQNFLNINCVVQKLQAIMAYLHINVLILKAKYLGNC